MVEELSFEQQDVMLCCRVLKVSRSGYYDWLKRPMSKRQSENRIISKKLREHWESSRRTYGAPRLLEKLKLDGINLGKNRVQKLMKAQNISGAGKRRFKVMTTDSKHELPIASRVFKAESHSKQVQRPNQYWGGDITYIQTDEGTLYASVFLDLFTRKVVGHSFRETMTSEIVIDALEMGLKQQGIRVGSELIAHSDRGSQYAAEAFRMRLRAHNITASMSRKGNCYDNAFVESFFRTLKVELVYQRRFKTKSEAVAALFEFIEVWYNRQRIHSSLGYKTPVEYEQQHLTAA